MSNSSIFSSTLSRTPDHNNFPDSLWLNLSNISKQFENSLDHSFRKNTGSYYTDLALAKYMIDEIFQNVDQEFIKELPTKIFFEPCVGSGNFVFAYLRKVHELGFSKKDTTMIINNIYACDINSKATELYRRSLETFMSTYFGIRLDKEYFTNHLSGGLVFNVEQNIPEYIPFETVFPEISSKGGVDIIATNPPYKNLKAERHHFNSEMEYQKRKSVYSIISKLARSNFPFSSDGVLNLYRFFMEEILTRYTKDNAIISLLIPSTILSDKTCSKLRTHILKNHCIKSINVIQENNPYIDAQQSLCTMLIHKGRQTQEIDICKDFSINNSEKTRITIKNVENCSTSNAIFALSKKEYDLLQQIRQFPSIKELNFIANKRGELDLTFDKEFITSEPTEFQLLRGRNIGYYSLNKRKVTEYVKKDFVIKSPKKQFISEPRIACQQVANIHKERRVTFSYVEKGCVLGNSCNFISVSDNSMGIDLFYLLGVLNSSIINWYFKLTSTNNHINNYEIDSFPIPTNRIYINRIKSLVMQYLNSFDEDLLEEIDILVYQAYGITLENEHQNNKHKYTPIVLDYYNDIKNITKEFSLDMAFSIINREISFDSIITILKLQFSSFDNEVCKFITEKYLKLKDQIILNHTSFKLSDLDLEMIRSVPQGGNWKNIPPSTIRKSKRLTKITKTGGRTTLYGRIDYDKPSYTITTYFNRPGNGTYVHPIHDRVISVREAARFQSFKDNYFFVGNKTNLLKQVGNAVPPLLAFQIGKRIIEATKCCNSMDLFCGAGGLTAGFKEAGINSILGMDIDKAACLTFRVNNPEIPVICDDITLPEVKQTLITIAKNNHVEIIAGGPPCQGFSHAGKRFVDDPRNKLFKHFIEVVAAVKPKVIIMENVEGILTLKDGEIYKQIIGLFIELGYRTEGRKLLASFYGVPQKRKRVIIISTRNDLRIYPSNLFPLQTTLQKDLQITACEAISDLENIECNEKSKYIVDQNISDYVKELRSILPYGNYVSKRIPDNIGKTFLEQLDFFK